MTLVSEIITDAYRETNSIALGEQPDAAQANEAARLFNRVVASLFGNEVGEALCDYRLASDGYADDALEGGEYLPSDVRIVASDGQSHSLKLPIYPGDGDRIQLVDAGSGFAAHPVTLVQSGTLFDGANASFVANTDGFNQTWMYRADLADWVRVLPLVATDSSPFPTEHDDALIGLLAMRLSPRYQQSLTAESRSAFTRAVAQLQAKYARTKRVLPDIAVVRTTGGHAYGGGPVTTRRFLNGITY